MFYVVYSPSTSKLGYLVEADNKDDALFLVLPIMLTHPRSSGASLDSLDPNKLIVKPVSQSRVFKYLDEIAGYDPTECFQSLDLGEVVILDWRMLEEF